MNKLKLIELILSAVSALIAAAKSVIKFIGYIIKLRDKPDASAA